MGEEWARWENGSEENIFLHSIFHHMLRFFCHIPDCCCWFCSRRELIENKNMNSHSRNESRMTEEMRTFCFHHSKFNACTRSKSFKISSRRIFTFFSFARWEVFHDFHSLARLSRCCFFSLPILILTHPPTPQLPAVYDKKKKFCCSVVVVVIIDILFASHTLECYWNS